MANDDFVPSHEELTDSDEVAQEPHTDAVFPAEVSLEDDLIVETPVLADEPLSDEGSESVSAVIGEVTPPTEAPTDESEDAPQDFGTDDLLVVPPSLADAVPAAPEAPEMPVVPAPIEELAVPAVQAEAPEPAPEPLETAAPVEDLDEQAAPVTPMLPATAFVEETLVIVDEDLDEVPTHTTTIPITVADVEDDYVPSDLMPNDVMEARDPDNPSTTAIRRDLMMPQESSEETAGWEAAVISPTAVAAQTTVAPTGRTPDSLDDAIFEGSTVVPIVPSRGKAHVASLFFGIFLLPAAWFLFADASARMLFPANAPVTTGTISWLALAQFLGAFVAALLFVLLTLRSTLGAWVWGFVIMLCGLPWLILPGMTKEIIAAPMAWLEAKGGVIGTNLAHHLQLSGFSGRFLLLGLMLLALAWVASSVRKRGRAEEALRAQVEKVNPEAAFFTARERRRAAKAARRKH